MQGRSLNTIDDTRLGEVLSFPGLSVVLVSSAWDGYGVIMRTLLQRFAERYGNVSFVVADIEHAPKLCRLFNVVSPPALLLVRNGELVARHLGVLGQGAIDDLIETNS